MHTDNEIPIGLFLSCSGQLPPVSSFQNDATGQISRRYLATGGKKDTGPA